MKYASFCQENSLFYYATIYFHYLEKKACIRTLFTLLSTSKEASVRQRFVLPLEGGSQVARRCLLLPPPADWERFFRLKLPLDVFIYWKDIGALEILLPVHFLKMLSYYFKIYRGCTLRCFNRCYDILALVAGVL